MKKRIFKWLILSCLGLFATLGMAIYTGLSMSLPALDGEHRLSALSAAVEITRDQHGIASIRGENEFDVAQALGFIHAQERFFQMDLARRLSAGELSVLFGSLTVELDKSHRLHRFRQRAKQIIDNLPGVEKRLLQRYVTGVNQGLSALTLPSFEYALLQQQPKPWRAEDSILVIFSMYLDLQESDSVDEHKLTQLRKLLPKDLFTFLTAFHSPWHASLDNAPVPAPVLPSSEWPNAIGHSSGNETSSFRLHQQQDYHYGSNNWAISSALTPYDSAMLANDMHLGINVPNIWFRASMYWTSPKDNRLHGITLPGVPTTIVGSNTQIAWGFTNSYADLTDVIYLDMTDVSDPKSHYQTTNGELEFVRYTEIIEVKNQVSVSFEVLETQWGPVEDPTAKPMKVVRWIAHEATAVNFNIRQLQQAKNVKQALMIAPTLGIPTQNLVVADSQGDIGWRLAGPLYARSADAGRFAQYSSEYNEDMSLLSAEQYPGIINPDNQRIWTANAPVLTGDAIKKIGYGPYAHSARSRHIKSLLTAKQTFSEKDLFTIQLATNNQYLLSWRDFVVEILQTQIQHDDPVLLKHLKNWSGNNGDHGTAIVDEYRYQYIESLLAQVLAFLQQQDDTFSRYHVTQYRDIPWLTLLQQQPDNLLPKQFDDWQALHQQVHDSVIGYINEHQLLDPNNTLAKRQLSSHRHPLSRSVPLLGYWLDMPSVPLAGNKYTANVDRYGFGASERFVVAPGHEQQGILQMPSSQSGHPLSPYYGAAHKDWSINKPTPLLPGPTSYQMLLLPK